ncbi:unnamed protein product [Rotaria socialis]|uniref:Uncharacterized protein n=1 Tax=Rotaria socialis TaxID=392032 RepID=A0A817X3G1_9BILA|nr:unnamed protein product [Rotaria socialis]CAF3369956.1 unnamed protein product [Rotaria socialis]CAF3424615.1 unnamed protein product [Rotaria socialis]CAF3720078.1 unnamed protein product [Rotaria socialis]CAF4247036.1 unnamed protein product [Rotaria socialis]
MLTELRPVPITNSTHSCCTLSHIRRGVHPIALENDFHSDYANNLGKQRQKLETYVFNKLEKYSEKKVTNLLHSTSFSHIRQRLKSDIKSFSGQFDQTIVSQDKLFQWIDEILEQIQSHITQLRSLFESQDGLEDLLKNYNVFSSNNANNQWQQLQLQKAKTILPNNVCNKDEEILLAYQKYIMEKFTPKELVDNKIPLKNQENIHLNEEYKKAEDFGRQYLTKMLDAYKIRQRPKLKLVQEMIDLGMKHMIKRPTKDEFRQASISSNILHKANFILKSKKSYSMSLQNIADDFMVSIYYLVN